MNIKTKFVFIFYYFFQMETKLRELQEKLAVEEADKIQLQNKLHQSLDSEVMIFFKFFLVFC